MENKETKASTPIKMFLNNSTDPNLSQFVKAAIDPPNDRCTKREYFAALAMQGLLAFGAASSIEDYAIDAVKIADVLIKELNKKIS